MPKRIELVQTFYFISRWMRWNINVKNKLLIIRKKQ